MDARFKFFQKIKKRYTTMCTCGKCKYRTKEDDEWICNNPDGENYSLEVERTDSCIDGEERGSR